MSESGGGVLCLVLWHRLWKHHFNYRAWEVAKIYAAKLVAEGVLSESEVAEPWAPEGEVECSEERALKGHGVLSRGGGGGLQCISGAHTLHLHKQPGNLCVLGIQCDQGDAHSDLERTGC